MPEHTNRTFICSVLFLDIAEYSQRSVAEQIRLKERFNAALTEAITGVATDDRIILDTGDGAAVSFLGDPEDAMFAALSLRDAVAGQDLTGGPSLQIRVGVNLGPVRLVKDINGNPNIIGDGINVAQRVMSFADPGQILVSRSYYDVMARLSEDYSQLFHYEGAKTDKHVREHEVYAINTAPASLRRPALATTPKPGKRIPAFSLPKFKLPHLHIPKVRVPAVNLRPVAAKFAVNPKLLVAAPLAFLLIVGTGVVARSYRATDVKPTTPPVSAAPAPKPEPVKLAQAEGPAAKAVEPEKPVEKPKQAGAPAKAKSKAPVRLAKAKDSVPAPAANQAAALSVKVSVVAFPWAEIYVDGTRQGVSPPLRTVTVPPGKHQIELRNTSYPAYVETVDAKPGAQISIKHKFR
jgi:class 3 adenylate cyclase